MQTILVLDIVLPPLLLLIGMAVGVAGAWWWLQRRAVAALRSGRAHDEEKPLTGGCAATTAAPLSSAAGATRRKGVVGEPPAIHVVACSALPQLTGGTAASTRPASASPPLGRRLTRPPALRTPDPSLPDIDGGAEGAAGPVGALLPVGNLSPVAGLGHHKTLSYDFGQLARAGSAVINQAVEDWEARSALLRLMSLDAGAASPTHAAAASLLSPAAAALFSPVTRGGGGGSGGAAMPRGEVHMDEIDLIECIGKGGYGCVYKASWRGAGVAVKYIVCPTEDAGSLGRAIREVVLSRKLAHPNVVQTYSWTVLTENEGQRCTPSSRSGASSPADPGWAGAKWQARPGSARGPRSRRASFDALRPASARRGLDARFRDEGCPARCGTPCSPASPALHRIMEHPPQEGPEATQHEGGWAASQAAWAHAACQAAHPPAAAQPWPARLVQQLVAEAAEQGQDEQQAEQASPSSREPSPEVVAAAAAGGKPLLKLALEPPSSCSPTSSPCIRAVHVQQPLAEAAAPGAAAPSPRQLGTVVVADAAASLPSSPFADAATWGPRRAFGGGGRADCAPLPASQPAPQRASASAGDEGEDVHARFSSYEEMMEHFRSLAAECPPPGPAQPQQPLPAPGAALPAPATSSAAVVRRSGSGLAGTDCDMTAASSFSDVLSGSGFMLEGSASGAGELSLLSSLPASPQHQHLRAGQGSWRPPHSAGSPRRVTPLGGTLSRLARGDAWLAAPQVPRQLRSEPASALALELALAASLPTPGWAEPGASAGLAGEERLDGCLADVQLAARQLSSVSVEPRLEQPQPAAAVAGPEAAEAGAAPGTRQGSPELPADEPSLAPLALLPPPLAASDAAGSSTLDLGPPRSSLDLQPSCSPSAPARTAPAAVASGQRCMGGSAHEHRFLPPSRLSLAGSSGTVTPRLCSLTSPVAPAGLVARLDSSPAVTPRQQSLRGGGPQASPGEGSGRGRGAGGLQRVEGLRSAAAGYEVLPRSADRLSVGSHDSFNSEEGFGSPVKQRRGGVKEVFLLEELALEGQEALMVVVMEFCDLGSLRKALRRRAFRPSPKWPFQTTYRALLRTAQEVAKGMGHIHEFNIVHGDLKPGNVLLKTHKVDRRGYIAKVADFGLSRALDFEDAHASTEAILGTIAYTAPETFAGDAPEKPRDVYAFGIMLWEMFYCHDPYDGLFEGQICVGVSDGTLRPEFQSDCPEPYRRLAEQCWHQLPEQRPTFEAVDAELVRIEMEFRLACHRTATNSKRTSGASAGGGSLPASRPGSPRVAPWGRQFQAPSLAG